MNRIQKIFQNRTEKVIPFLTAGFPNKDVMVDIVLAAEQAGADMIELGMPFSDPLADGPIIQYSSQLAIKNGVDIAWILDSVAIIRESSQIPLALMGYINPILKYGSSKFLNECKKSGVDGLIIPDFPPEEAEKFIKTAAELDICIILLVAPNTSNERIKKISIMSGTLIYCVAILGITGGEGVDMDKLTDYLKRVEENSACPFVVGFGIKNREDVVAINKIAHGAVIGSAIIKKLKSAKDPIKTVYDYIEILTKENK